MKKYTFMKLTASLFLTLYLVGLSSCDNDARGKRQIELLLIQEANRQAINNGNMPFDSVHIKGDTIFYYRNNQNEGFSVSSLSIEDSSNSVDFEKLNTGKNVFTESAQASEQGDVVKDSIFVKNNMMMYYRNNEFKGKTVIETDN